MVSWTVLFFSSKVRSHSFCAIDCIPLKLFLTSTLLSQIQSLLIVPPSPLPPLIFAWAFCFTPHCHISDPVTKIIQNAILSLYSLQWKPGDALLDWRQCWRQELFQETEARFLLLLSLFIPPKRQACWLGTNTLRVNFLPLLILSSRHIQNCANQNARCSLFSLTPQLTNTIQPWLTWQTDRFP